MENNTPTQLKELKAREERRIALQREINSYKVDIDRDCFRKAPREKMELKVAKREWKNKQKLERF